LSPSPSCPVCGAKGSQLWAQAKDWEYRTSDETFHYYKCGDCGCLLIHPVPLKRLREIYPSNYYSFSGGKTSLVEEVKRRLDRAWLKRLASLVPGEGPLAALDIGGGTGWMLDELKAVEPRLTRTQVVDLDPAAAKEAKRKGHAYFNGPVETFKTQDKFHLILMINLIEHVKDPVAVLKKVRGLLAPGGVAFLKTPNIDSWDARLFRHRHWGGYHCPRHWVLFDAPSFRRALDKAGLKEHSLAYTQGAPFWALSVLIAWLGEAGLRRRGKEPLFRHALYAPLAAAFAALDLARGLFFKTSQMMITVKGR